MNYENNDCTDMQIEGATLVRYSGQDAVVTIPDGIEKLEEWAFSDTHDRWQREMRFVYTEVARTLETVYLPASLKIISKGAFHGEKLLKQVFFSEGLEEIGELAFAFCKSLPDVRLPDTIRSISKSAFRGCEALKQVVIPRAVEGEVARRVTSHSCIPANMFTRCWALENVTIPHGTVVIGEEAFSECQSLSEVVIPNSVEEIMDRAFDGCIGLRTFMLPANVKRVGHGAIPHGEFSKLESILVAPENQAFCSVDGVLYTKDKKTLISCPVRYNRSTFAVPDGVEEIAAGAFDGCKMIKKILLPDSVKRVGPKAFFGMSNLNKVVLPSQLEEISEEAFAACNKLRDITWPKNLKKIGNDAFSRCGFSQITIPDGVHTIGDYAFEAVREETYFGKRLPSGLVTLEKVSLPRTVEKIGKSAFSGVRRIEVFDTIDSDAKPAQECIDNINGGANGLLGFAGIYMQRGYLEVACNAFWFDHVITVRSAEDGSVKHRVRMPAKQKRKVYCTFASSWGKNGEFNFNAIDKIFDELTPDAKLSYAMDRLLCQKNISEAFLIQLIEFLKKRAKRAITRALEGDSILDLSCLAKHGIVKKASVPSYIKTANELKAVQCEEWLLAWNNEES